ncbi:hypothetical protein [Pseudomonas lini]
MAIVLDARQFSAIIGHPGTSPHRPKLQERQSVWVEELRLLRVATELKRTSIDFIQCLQSGNKSDWPLEQARVLAHAPA